MNFFNRWKRKKESDIKPKFIILGKKENFFYCGDGIVSDDISECKLFDLEEDAKSELNLFDNPNDYRIWRVDCVVGKKNA